MNSNQHKKALIFFSAGVGDAILLVPLVNELKKQGYHVTGLFTSPFDCESIFDNTNLFNVIKIKKSKLSLLFFSIFSFRKYDAVYLNHFAFSNSRLTLAAFLGKDVYTNYKHMTCLQSSKAIHFIEPKANTHDALQHLFLYQLNARLGDLNFNLNYNSTSSNSFGLSKEYIVIQVSSANNNAPYKNWAIENWLELFKKLQTTLPSAQLVILGDKTEIQLHENLNSLKTANVVSLIGKTALNDVMDIIYNSQFYIGLDSGLMHIAVALNKPTFTIWGASNPTLYGYEWLDHKHKVVTLNLPCAPCSSWMNANTSRVTNPLACPDFKCIKDISVEKVVGELDSFIVNIRQ